MTTETAPKPAKAAAEPKIKVVQVNPDTFDLICKALFNNSTELHAMARDISELRLAVTQIGITLSAMCPDLRALAEARPVNVETLARRLADADGGEMPLVLRNVQGAASR